MNTPTEQSAVFPSPDTTIQAKVDWVCMRDAALALAADGIPVFPCSRATKKPLTCNGFKGATTTEPSIRNQWFLHPNAAIGVPTGKPSGLVVLDTDLDPSKGVDGEAELARLMSDLGGSLPATRTVSTPRGGRHRYFRAPAVLVKSSAGVVGKGIDVRGDGGYVIVPPSQNSNGSYTTVDDSEPAELPQWLLELMSGPTETANTGEESVPHSFHVDDGPPASVEDLRDALSAIPSDNYDEWVKVGMALKRWNGETGFAVWDEWSSKSQKYAENDCLKKWPTFNNGAGGQPVTVKSIFHTARKNGWTPKTQGVAGIILPSDCGWTITESARHLFQIIAPTETVFRRARVMVEMSASGFAPVTYQRFRSLIEDYGHPVMTHKRHKDEVALVPKQCSAETAKALMETPGVSLLPEIAYVTRCPVAIRAPGGIEVLGAGYHKVNGGLFVADDGAPPAVPVGKAILELRKLLKDFRFETPADESRAIASLLTPALRFGGWIEGHIPIEIAEADQSQSGKTYRQQVVAAIYNDAPQMLSQRDGGVGSLDESFAQKVLNGHPFILFDNLRGKLNSQVLEAFLTANGEFGVRVPYKGELVADTRRFVVSVTSNGFEATQDLVNRASFVRILKQPAGYQFATYSEGNLLAHVKKNHLHYLGCVFSVLGEWARQGGPTTGENRHSFREWARPLDWIVQNLFKCPPLLEDHEKAQHRACRPAEGWIRKLGDAFGRGCVGLGIPQNYISLLQICEQENIEIPGLETFGDRTKACRVMGSLMARAFGQNAMYSTESGILIHREQVPIYDEDRKQYRNSWVFTFDR